MKRNYNVFQLTSAKINPYQNQRNAGTIIFDILVNSTVLYYNEAPVKKP